MKATAEEVAARASELAAQKRLTDREVSIDATGKPDLLRDMRRGRMPSAERLQALADTLSTTVDFLRAALHLPCAQEKILPLRWIDCLVMCPSMGLRWGQILT